jgi:hypothetical protein
LWRKSCAFLDEDRRAAVCVCHWRSHAFLRRYCKREPGLDDPAPAVSLARR